MNDFNKNGYVVIRDILSPEVVQKLYDYCKLREKDKDGILNDNQVNGSVSFYNDNVISDLQKEILGMLEKYLGMKLLKTYSYWRMYLKNAVLKAHVDRPACEISMSIDIGGDSWEIYIKDKNENIAKINLRHGDAVVYRGCEVMHWRNKFNGEKHAQAFLHYVDKHGKYADLKDDKGVVQ